MRRLIVLILQLAAVAATAVPASACACGVALRAEVTSERALVIDRGDRQEIIASFDLEVEDGERAAVVLPVPADPEVDALDEDPLLYLDQATIERTRDDEFDTAGPAGGSVDVIGREEIGGYDVTRLRAGDPKALEQWLDENGYALPDGIEPILVEYVTKQWRYVAIRLAEGESGRLQPLRVSFAADDELVYPMKLTQLGTKPVNLTLYVLSDEPRRAAGLDVAFERRVDALEPAVPENLTEFFDGSEQLTKLTATGADPQDFTNDLTIRAAAAPEDEGIDWWVYTLYGLFLAAGIILWEVRRGSLRSSQRRPRSK